MIIFSYPALLTGCIYMIKQKYENKRKKNRNNEKISIFNNNVKYSEESQINITSKNNLFKTSRNRANYLQLLKLIEL